MKALALALVALTACAGGLDDGGTNLTDGQTGDAPPMCNAVITTDPPFPTASALAPIRAGVSIVDQPGVLTYDWHVTFLPTNTELNYSYEASDHSQIGFLASTPGNYEITVSIGGASFACNHADSTVNVADPNAHAGIVRLRTVPSSTLAPPQETIIQISNADFTRDIGLDSGLAVNGLVHTSAGPGVAAYVKLIPTSAPYAFTELFTDGTGTFATRLLGQVHNVLVIPTSSALAPKLLAWMPGMAADFTVGGGTVVSGTVHNPAGTGFAGAKVQLFAGGVPSTIGTTAPDGSFSLRADLPAGQPITVEVSPPVATGLPRLEATGAFDVTQSVQVTYAASLATCDLAGDAVKRSGANQANAKVTVVGTLGGVPGAIATGSTSVNATGTVHVVTTANGSGVLPSTLVPRSNALSAAVSLSATDWAVDAIDTSACGALTIDAQPPVTRTGTARNAGGPLNGVRIEATPVGPLAQADALPIVATSATDGSFSIDLATGGTYDVRFVDPQARAAPLALLATTPANLPTTATLPKAIVMSGKVSVTGTSNPIVGASVQILCSSCSGIDAARPIVQTATDSQSSYRIAVPDPGAM